MNERVFRLILGVTLLAVLYFDLSPVLWAVMGLLLFEGLTNWRIPILVSRLRYGAAYVSRQSECVASRLNFDAERALRFFILALLLLSAVVFPEPLWFLPWFIGIALTSAGLTNICPMAMLLKWVGFRPE